MDTFTTQVQVKICALARMHKLMLILVSGVTVVDAKLSKVSVETAFRRSMTFSRTLNRKDQTYDKLLL